MADGHGRRGAAGRRPGAARRLRSCSPRPAPVSICSTTMSIAAGSSPTRCGGSRHDARPSGTRQAAWARRRRRAPRRPVDLIPLLVAARWGCWRSASSWSPRPPCPSPTPAARTPSSSSCAMRSPWAWPWRPGLLAFTVPVSWWERTGAWLFLLGVARAGAGAGPWHRTQRQWRDPLDPAGAAQPPTLRVHQAVRGHLHRRLSGAPRARRSPTSSPASSAR